MNKRGLKILHVSRRKGKTKNKIYCSGWSLISVICGHLKKLSKILEIGKIASNLPTCLVFEA
jgi:hypothetical protein